MWKLFIHLMQLHYANNCYAQYVLHNQLITYKILFIKTNGMSYVFSHNISLVKWLSAINSYLMILHSIISVIA